MLKNIKLLIFALIMVVGCALLCSGCKTKNPVIKTEKYNRVIRVACVGDSITWGDKILDRDKYCYPVVLGNLLGAKFEVRNFGVNGATLLKRGDFPYWKTGAFEESLEFAPDVVIIMLGTNDSKPQNWKFKDEFMPDLTAFIYKYSYLPNKPSVWLCTPCPVYKDGQWGITPKVIQDEMLPMIEAVAENTKLPLIDIFHTMSYRSELFPDTVHPNAEGAEIMARTISGALLGY